MVFQDRKGQYGEGDRFLGIKVPVLRKVACRHLELSFEDLASLLASPVHEHRFVALEILVAQYERADEQADKVAIFEFYLRQTKRINNWDLVDTSAPYIVGEHLSSRSRKLLVGLARSENVWERRIAIVSTLALIKKGQIRDTSRIARMLIKDEQDLIRKAVGWALREAGKVSQAELLVFLRKHYSNLSRTTLQYAIEKFGPEERKRILTGDFGHDQRN